jgi:hypothetical protein
MAFADALDTTSPEHERWLLTFCTSYFEVVAKSALAAAQRRAKESADTQINEALHHRRSSSPSSSPTIIPPTIIAITTKHSSPFRINTVTGFLFHN